MALKKQNIPILLNKGRQDIVDPKTVEPGTPTRLTNAVFTKANRYSKRFGTRSLSKSILGGGEISSAKKLESFQDELLLLTEDRVYTYAPESDEWVDKGIVPLIVTSVEEVIRNTEQQTSPDANIVRGTIVSAWEDTRGGVFATAYDAISNAIKVPDSQIAAAPAMRPKVVSVGNFAFAFYASGSTIRLRRYSTTSGTMFLPEQSLTGDLNVTGFFDVCVFNNAIILVWHTVTNEIRVCYVNQDGIVGSPVTGFPTATSFPTPVTGCLGAWVDLLNGVIHVGWFDAATGTHVRGIRAVDFGSQYAPVSVDATLSPTTRNISGILVSGSTTRLFYEVSAASPSNALVKTATVTALGITTAPLTVLRSVGMASKPFVNPSGVHLAVVHDSTLQSTYFVTDSDGLIHSRSASGTAGGLSSRASHLPEIFFGPNGQFLHVAEIKTQVITENNTTFTRTGVSRFSHDFTLEVFPKTSEFAGSLYLPGAFLQAYDGDGFVEAGYHIYPEGVSAIVAGAGSIGIGTYLYYAMYEWVDAKGQLHRSAPSIPLTVVVGGANSTVTLTIPTLRITARQGTRTAPIIAVYRTTAGGTIPYRVSSRTVAGGNNGLFLSDPTVDSITFVDVLADTAITSQEILYTAGGELENLPTPPCSAATVFKNRLFLNTTDGSREIFFSKESSAGVGAGFSPLLILTPDNSAADTLGLGVLDDKLILFKNYSAYVTFGDGPNATGVGGAFSVPERIATSTGCPYAASITSAKQGLFYKSTKGLRLLDRGLNEVPIGIPVKDMDGLTISSGIVMPEAEEIRFLHADGDAAIYNDLFQQWSSFTNYAAIDSAIWLGVFAFAEADGTVRLEDRSSFTDAGQFYPMTVEMGWISLASVEGFQRVWRLLLLGEYKSPHKLRIRVGKNFEPSWTEIVHFDPATALNQATYGSSSPYGAEYLMGNGSSTSQVALDSVYQARIHLATQKCESIRFEIMDIQVSGTFGESMNLSALSLEVGAKTGSFKASQSKSAGSKE